MNHPNLFSGVGSEHREDAVIVSSNSHPLVVAVAQPHRPKIEIARLPVAGSVERCRPGHSLIMLCFLDEFRSMYRRVLRGRRAK